MSPSERIMLFVPADDGVRVTVADGSFAPVISGTGGVEVKVGPGLYSVRYVAGSTVHQELVSVPPGESSVHVPRPTLRFDSPVPLAASTLVAETHRPLAESLSQQVHASLGSGAQLFVFVRDRDRRGRRSALVGLTLHDLKGKMLLDLAEASGVETHDRSRPPCAGVTVAVDPGPYRLRVRTEAIGTLEQLVYLAAGWQTQVFLERRSYPGATRGRTADLGDASILMAEPHVGFDPGRDDLRLTELARQSLYTRRSVLSEDEVRRMVYGKFRNPMLSIYAAHMLLQSGEGHGDLLAEMCDNLDTLVPGHPDVAAIRLAIGQPRGAVFEVPPMLRASWQLVIHASADQGSLVPPDSLSAKIAGDVYDATTWLIWRVRRARRGAGRARRPVQEDVSVVDLMNNLAAAVPELGAVLDRLFAEMEPAEQDLFAFATSGATSPGDDPLPAPFGDERTVLEALGMPKTVAQSKLLDVAHRLDVTL
jgi:hypothetical protein